MSAQRTGLTSDTHIEPLRCCVMRPAPSPLRSDMCSSKGVEPVKTFRPSKGHPNRRRRKAVALPATLSVLLLALAGIPANAAEVAPEDHDVDADNSQLETVEVPLPDPIIAPARSDAQAPEDTATTAAYTQAQCQSQVLALVNAERSREGLVPLVADAGLNSISFMWSDWMVTTGVFEHLPTVYGDIGWGFWNATGNRPGGENIAAGQGSPAEVVTAWMNSPGHRANILHPTFRRMGLACVDSSTSGAPYYYWTQQFSFGETTPSTSWERIPVPTEQLSTSIEGERKVGSTLSAKISGRLPTSTTLSYQWTANGAAIAGATRSTFVPTHAQVGKKIGVTVEATANPFFYRTTVVPMPADTVNVKGVMTPPSPTISGTPKVGSTVSVVNGAAADFSPAADSVRYQWLRNGTAIPGATSAAYKLVSADATRKVSVRVTGTKANYADATATTSGVTVAERYGVRRLSGATRYDTNLKVSGVYGGQGKPVFVATGANFADALSVGPAVAVTQGTLFLTSSTGMNKDMLASVRAKNPSAIYVIGGRGAVPDSVLNQLRSATGKQPQRIGGSSRYETSAKVATTFFGSRAVDYAFVATGTNYPDALSAAAAGGALGAPVVLVNGKTDKNLAPEAINFLRSKNIKKIYIAGGTGAVNGTISANLSKSWTVERLGGATRYGTNEKVNEMLAKHGGATSVSGIWLATGKNFPDALSAAAPAGKLSQRLVLSNGSCIPKPVVSSWIKGSSSEVSQVTLVGGEGVLGASVERLTQCS